MQSFSANNKLKETLAEITLKRKLEEEAAALNTMKAEARRKKFKEVR